MNRWVFTCSVAILLMALCGCMAGEGPDQHVYPQFAPTTLVAEGPADAQESAAGEVAAPLPRAKLLSLRDGMSLVMVPAGEFLMGSPTQPIPEDYQMPQFKPIQIDGEMEPRFQPQIDPSIGASDDEKPQHVVTLDAYWLDQTEVTTKMFAAFLNEAGKQTTDGIPWLDANSPHTRLVQEYGVWLPARDYENHPMVEVSWYGAQAYCEWAGRRLPTEAEWEKAARGTRGLVYPWGNQDPNCTLANFDSSCQIDSTTEVGSFPAGSGPYGALDMSGNVWEWVADWYQEDYYAQSPANNPPGPESGRWRVLRGGSWHLHQCDLRTANRAKYSPESSGPDIGFRCAQDAASSPASGS